MANIETDAEVIARAERNGYVKHETLDLWRMPEPRELTCLSVGLLRLTPMCDDPNAYPSDHGFDGDEIGDRCFCGNIQRIADYDYDGRECMGYMWL